MNDTENVEDQSLGRSSSPQVLTRTFNLTISPKEPVTKECQEAIVRYVKKECAYSYVVVETGKSGKLHLHACMIFSTHREKKKLQENINNRIVRKTGHPSAKNGLATQVQVCPGHKWYDEYLRKEEGVIVLHDAYDREHVEPYFPEVALQEYLQNHTRSSGPADKYMAEHKRQWIDRFPDDTSYESAIQYLKHRMYVLEDMIIIQDKRRLCQLAYSLYEYRNQITDACVEEINHGSRMTGNSDVARVYKAS